MKVSMSSIHLQAVFSAQCKITSFPVDAQTPSAPHSGTESRRSTETRTAQSGAASEDSAHGYQFASAAASPSQTPSPRQTRPMCPVRRNAMNRRIWAVRQPRAVNPRIIRQHMQSAARHIAAKHFVRRIPRLPLVQIALRCHIRARHQTRAAFPANPPPSPVESWVDLLQDGFGDDYSALKGACQM